MWGDENGLHSHQFYSVNSAAHTFESEREAESFGITKARASIDGQH
jgi:hypothetical protein